MDAEVFSEAKEINQKLNVFITIADKAEGKPIAIKDNICTAGLRTTAGSKILHNYVPVFDATVIAKLKAAGYGVVGKTAMDEFGFGTFSTNCAYKTPKNPWDTERACGGSSGGSAAYVAASKLCDVAIAQSTGGSISCPASFCGVVGITPTYGLVSRYGLIDYANSMDKIGVVAKTVKEAAGVLSVIAGHDAMDQTTQDAKKQDYAKCCIDSKLKFKLAVPKEYFVNVDKQVSKTVWGAIEKLEKLGCTYQEVSLPTTNAALAAYYLIAVAEASTNLAKFCGMRYGLSANPEGKGFNQQFSEIREQGFGAEAKRRILLGTFARMAGWRDQYYSRALKVRTKVIDDFKKVFKKFDAIAAPTMPILPPKFSDIKKLSPVQTYALDVLTVPANLAGIPHVSVPCGLADGLPIGLHLIGDHFTEPKLIQIAHAYEKARGPMKYPRF